MILQEKDMINKYYFYTCKSNASSSANFFKNLNLYILKNRLLINTKIKFYKLKNKFNLVWSKLFNEKAYVNRRRILGRNTSSSYK